MRLKRLRCSDLIETLIISQAAGAFELEELGSAGMTKPDPTGGGSLLDAHLVFCLFINVLH